MSNAAYMFIFVFMGVILSVGFILFGVAYWRAKVFPRWAITFFTLGAVLFGIGMAIPIRTLGLVLWVIGWGWMGYLLWRENAA